MSLKISLALAQDDGYCRSDSDDDGIMDCFDRCPNTKQGIRVDSHGCPRDTDGDGIADYKDQQMITPNECQPSDTNGVGVCPEIRCEPVVLCCKEGYPDRSVFLQGNEIKLNVFTEGFMKTLVEQMKQSPNFPVLLKTSPSGNSEKALRIAKARLNCFYTYLIEQDIDKERIALKLEPGGLENLLLVTWKIGDDEGKSIMRGRPFTF